jgi:hypothetical protein
VAILSSTVDHPAQPVFDPGCGSARRPDHTVIPMRRAVAWLTKR